jgi:hypothetical protein
VNIGHDLVMPALGPGHRDGHALDQFIAQRLRQSPVQERIGGHTADRVLAHAQGLLVAS